MLGNPHQFDQYVCQKKSAPAHMPPIAERFRVQLFFCVYISYSQFPISLLPFFFFLHFGLGHMDSWPWATIPTTMGQTYKSSCLSATGSSRTFEWLPPPSLPLSGAERGRGPSGDGHLHRKDSTVNKHPWASRQCDSDPPAWLATPKPLPKCELCYRLHCVPH